MTKNKDKPPLFLGLLLLSLIVVFNPIKLDKGLQSEWTEQQYQISQRVYLSGNTIPFQVSGEVLASLMTIEDPRLFKIIECESNFRNVCNSNGCKYGIGVAQLLQKTADYCSEKLGKTIDPYNPIDNIECANWLLENEGSQHWGTATSLWGSYSCWSAN